MIDMNNLQGMMDQALKMQQETKERMAKMAVEGSAGGDSVTVVVNGSKEITKIEISEHAVKNPALLADLILAAANEAYQKVDAQSPQMGDISNMLNNVDLSKVMDMFKQ